MELTRDDSGSSGSAAAEDEGGEEQRSNSPQPGRLESLDVGMFGSIVDIDDEDDSDGPEISVLGG